MQWSPHAPASGAPGATCLSPPQLVAVGTPSCPGPLPRDWTVCLSVALFILLLCEREFSSWQTAARISSHTSARVCTPDPCLAASPVGSQRLPPTPPSPFYFPL